MSIRVIFKDPENNIIELDAETSITIGELRKLYASKGGNDSYVQWKINAVIIKDNQRLSDFLINRKMKKITISVVHAIRGGGGNDTNVFANLNDDFITYRNVAKYDDPDVPDWRTVCKGINLYGICENSKCIAKGQTVIMMVDSKEIDLYKESFMGICPICKKHFDLDTCGFRYCDYQFEGCYFDKEKDDWINLPEDIKSTKDGKISYYDPNKVVEGKKGKVKYKTLILKVVKIHDYE